VYRRWCNGSATVVLPCGERGATVVQRYHSHVEPDPHGSDTVVVPLQYRCNTVAIPLVRPETRVVSCSLRTCSPAMDPEDGEWSKTVILRKTLWHNTFRILA
jgi:hypothetical protein